MNKIRGGRDFSPEEIESCMINKAPGTPNLSVLSFHGGFHGRTAASLACTHSKYIHKIDVPLSPWPVASFPRYLILQHIDILICVAFSTNLTNTRYKYPLEDFIRENTAEDERCLAMTEDIIANSEKAGCPITGVIVEPIQAEGGDHHGSNEWFQGLQVWFSCLSNIRF